MKNGLIPGENFTDYLEHSHPNHEDFPRTLHDLAAHAGIYLITCDEEGDFVHWPIAFCVSDTISARAFDGIIHALATTSSRCLVGRACIE